MEARDVLILIGRPTIEIIEWLQNERLLSPQKLCEHHDVPVNMNLRAHNARKDEYVW